MRTAKFVSDYSPDTVLRLVEMDDGDIVLRISGRGEMRFATNGGKLHGEGLCRVRNAFSEILTVLSKEEESGASV